MVINIHQNRLHLNVVKRMKFYLLNKYLYPRERQQDPCEVVAVPLIPMQMDLPELVEKQPIYSTGLHARAS